MYSGYKDSQCLICFQDLRQSISLFHLIHHPPICLTCLQSFDVLDRTFSFDGYSLTILYHYNDFFKKLLFQYKGLYDYALKDAFLQSFLSELKVKYKHHIIAVVPSNENKKRDFYPNEEIVKTFHSSIFKGLYKNKLYKQTDQKDRSFIKDVIQIKDGNRLTNQKVLLFDDVITSGYTIRSCIKQIEKYHPKSIEILVLATNQFSTLFTSSTKYVSKKEI